MRDLLKARLRVTVSIAFSLGLLLVTPSYTDAATSVKLFQLTTDPTQQSGPLIYNDLMIYGNHGDIWGYSLKDKEAFPILEKTNLQNPTGFYGDLLVYEDIDEITSNYDIRLYNIKTKEDILIAGGAGAQTSVKYPIL